MAIDTREKRLSMIGFSRVYIPMMPTIDGTVNQADRASLMHMYSGIPLAELVTYTVNIIMRLAASTIDVGFAIPSRVVRFFKNTHEVKIDET